MKYTHTNNLVLVSLACCLTGIIAPSPSSDPWIHAFRTSEAVVMEQGDVWPKQQYKRFHNNRCEVRLQRDGNFIVKRMLAPNPWNQYLKNAWTTGGDGADEGVYHAELDEDGSLVVIRTDGNGTDTRIYTSNIGEPEALKGRSLARTHKLVISEECVLTTYRDDVEVWTNNRYGGLVGEPGLSDYLQKGEMMYLNQCHQCGNQPGCVWVYQALVLQHDCILVHFAGRDVADLKENPMVLWSSRTPRPDLKDCHLYSDADKVRLYEGKLEKTLPQFAPRSSTSYWEADDDFVPNCDGGYEVLLKINGGVEPSC